MEESISVLLKLRYSTKSEQIMSCVSSISTCYAQFLNDMAFIMNIVHLSVQLGVLLGLKNTLWDSASAYALELS